MDNSLQQQDRATDALRLLAYVQYLAETARSDTARHAFALFLQQERQRFETASGFDSPRPSMEASRDSVASPDRTTWRQRKRLPKTETVY